MALGPLSIGIRLVGSVLWLAIVVSAVLRNAQSRAPPDPMIMIEVVGLVLAMWLLVQAPLWVARGLYRFQLDRSDKVSADGDSRQLQFGIRELLIVTAAVAAVLAFGRVVVQWEHISVRGSNQILKIAVIVVCNSLVAFTVITGSLLRRHWLFAVALGICGAAAITLVEWRLFPARGSRDLELATMFTLTNAIQFGWLFINLGVLRWAGYGLVISDRRTPHGSAEQKAIEPAG